MVQKQILYRQFIEECIIECDNTLSLVELYSYFKDWFKEGWPNMQLPIKNNVKEYFEKFCYLLKNYFKLLSKHFLTINRQNQKTFESIQNNR